MKSVRRCARCTVEKPAEEIDFIILCLAVAEEIDFIILCLAVAERNASNQFAKDKLKALRGSNATI